MSQMLFLIYFITGHQTLCKYVGCFGGSICFLSPFPSSSLLVSEMRYFIIDLNWDYHVKIFLP